MVNKLESEKVSIVMQASQRIDCLYIQEPHR